MRATRSRGKRSPRSCGRWGRCPFWTSAVWCAPANFIPTEKEWDTYLKDYCARPCPSTVFLIVNSAKKANAAQLSRKGGVTFVDCSREDEETLSRWLFGVARKRDWQMDADAAQLLVRYCAQGRRPNAVRDRKLAYVLGENGRVTRAQWRNTSPRRGI